MSETKVSIQIEPCTETDFVPVTRLIAEFCLDDIKLERHQFITAKKENTIAGFARLRDYTVCNELCSLGVTEDLRMKGIGRSLVKEIISKSEKPLFVVTVIPEFFSKFGFKEVSNYPEELNYKLEYCQNSLSVPEPYVVMECLQTNP